MAEAKKNKRRIRSAPETLRERTEKTSKKPLKSRRLRKTVRTAGRPFAWLWQLVVKILRPFRFILRPFKTKPLRFIGRLLAAVLLLKYFRQSFSELKEVAWPDRKQTTQLTLAVFTFAIVFGLLVAITDFGLDKLFKKVLLK